MPRAGMMLPAPTSADRSPSATKNTPQPKAESPPETDGLFIFVAESPDARRFSPHAPGLPGLLFLQHQHGERGQVQGDVLHVYAGGSVAEMFGGGLAGHKVAEAAEAVASALPEGVTASFTAENTTENSVKGCNIKITPFSSEQIETVKKYIADIKGFGTTSQVAKDFADAFFVDINE